MESAIVLRDHPREQQVVAALGDLVGEPGKQAHEEWIGQVLLGRVAQRQNHADGAGPSLRFLAALLIWNPCSRASAWMRARVDLAMVGLSCGPMRTTEYQLSDQQRERGRRGRGQRPRAA